jgi:glycosyltransferase involved in cell wall biosynthesis
MKIAYVLGEYPSLSETFIAREIDALRKRGFEIEVWALRAGAGARQVPVSNAARIALKLRAAGETHWENIGRDWARREKNALQNVAHIHAGWASFPAAIARGAAGVLQKPWSFFGHARDLWVEGENLARKISDAKFVAACTREGTDFLQSQAPQFAHKVLYAPHGIEISGYTFRAERALHEPIRVLAVGRLVPKKGFAVLLDALQYDSLKRWQIALIGEGRQRSQLEKRIAQLRLQNRVQLRGAQAHQEVVAEMQQADFLVMPSTPAADGDRDGLPNVLLEAAACGLPIIATRAGAIEDLLDESCARLCEPNDALALYETMCDAAAGYGECLRRARNARARVVEKFDIEKNIEILARAFEG